MLLWSAIKPGEQCRRPKLIMVGKDKIHWKNLCHRICGCFNTLAAYLSLLSAFDTVILICFHPNIPNEASELMCIYVIDTFLKSYVYFEKLVWIYI